MKHYKIEENKTVLSFFKHNLDFMLLIGAVALGAVIGSVYKINAVPYAVFDGDSPFLTVFIGSFCSLVIYVFAVFFCGTSAIGFISPAILFIRGLSFGNSLSAVYQDGAGLIYYLCEMPFMVVTSALLAVLVRDNIVLSANVFRTCLYKGAGAISYNFPSFLIKSIFALVLCAAACFIYSFIFIYEI